MSIAAIDKARVVADVLNDSLSAPGYVLNATSTGAAAAIPILGMATGSLGIFSGAHSVGTSLNAANTAWRQKDREGVALNSMGALAGASQMSYGAASLASGIAKLAGNSIAVTGAGVATVPILITMYGLFIAKAALSLKHVHDFKKSLSQNDDELKAFLLAQYEKNPEHLKRMVGNDIALMIEKLANGKSVASIDMVELRAGITKECLKQNIVNIFIIFVSVIGQIATIASLLLAASCPILSPILFAIGSILWIFVDCVPCQEKFSNMLANKMLEPSHKKVLPAEIQATDEITETSDVPAPIVAVTSSPSTCLKPLRSWAPMIYLFILTNVFAMMIKLDEYLAFLNKRS